VSSANFDEVELLAEARAEAGLADFEGANRGQLDLNPVRQPKNFSEGLDRFYCANPAMAEFGRFFAPETLRLRFGAELFGLSPRIANRDWERCARRNPESCETLCYAFVDLTPFV
jgi:hypothetical protein